MSDTLHFLVDREGVGADDPVCLRLAAHLQRGAQRIDSKGGWKGIRATVDFLTIQKITIKFIVASSFCYTTQTSSDLPTWPAPLPPPPPPPPPPRRRPTAAADTPPGRRRRREISNSSSSSSSLLRPTLGHPRRRRGRRRRQRRRQRRPGRVTNNNNGTMRKEKEEIPVLPRRRRRTRTRTNRRISAYTNQVGQCIVVYT